MIAVLFALALQQPVAPIRGFPRAQVAGERRREEMLAAVPRRDTLRAQMDGSQMKVWIDSKVVWEGDLGKGALAFDGPVGVRTDNGQFEFDLFTPKPGGAKKSQIPPCKAGEEE